ncbi:MAG: formate--tetrahydrofolate ligase [Gemmatimonadetes bacterium]|nr:formate--tetrahydrofolate ligase [Gemmatimonadota bacterium]
MPSDIAIAQQARLRPISDVAAELDLPPDALHPFGRHIAKLPLEVAAHPSRGRLVLVTAISPTPAGEGKTTVSIGLAQALRRLGTRTVLAIREPSLGPVFGVKGGAAGGGYSQVVPMEEINLHFTGDFHAIAAAHNLLSALADNALHHGTVPGLGARRVTWPRTIDMNDRALREVITGVGAGNGVVREGRWVIVPASEVMAIVALARDLPDLQARLGRIVVGSSGDAARVPIRARDLAAADAMALLLKQALAPNLVQTLEGGPALVHAGPFGNLAHGCNSLVATRTALALGDVVVTEAGFGSDLGAEKFFNIKCRLGGLTPAAAVLVATVRSLKMHGGVPLAALDREDLGALERGLPHLAHHVANVRQHGVPVVVAINRRASDTDAEVARIADACAALGVTAVPATVFAEGGAGGEGLAQAVLGLLEGPPGDFRHLYEVSRPIAEKAETIARRVYGADGVDFTPAAARQVAWLEANGLGDTPVCMAKTQYSFTDDPKRLGVPTGFRLTVTEVTGAAGAGFVVARCGEIMTMPGLAATPAAARMRMAADGTVEGLS